MKPLEEGPQYHALNEPSGAAPRIIRTPELPFNMSRQKSNPWRPVQSPKRLLGLHVEDFRKVAARFDSHGVLLEGGRRLKVFACEIDIPRVLQRPCHGPA